MNILFAGHKERGTSCLRGLVAAGHMIVGVVAHAPAPGAAPGDVAEAGRALGLPVMAPDDINAPAVVAALRALAPDLLVLAGYGPILREPAIGIAPLGAVNLHGGKLPEYRGSSPLNWALINGEATFTISIIAVDRGVDTGDVLLDRTFPIGPHDTIADLHRTANEAFPGMLVDVVASIAAGTSQRRRQDDARAAYYPLRFPDDGMIFWDTLTASQIHNRIRALTRPYPGAFTYAGGRRVMLYGSKPAVRTYHGEPGRIYLKNQHGLLIAATDRCLWITDAVFSGDGRSAVEGLRRYETVATLRGLALSRLDAGGA